MICPNCNAETEASWRYCRSCGREVQPAEAVAQAAPAAPDGNLNGTYEAVTIAAGAVPAETPPVDPAYAETSLWPPPEESPAAALPPQPPVAVAAATRAPRMWIWRRRWFPRATVAIALLALAGGLTYTVVNDVQTHSTLTTTQSKLASTRGTLASTQKDLASTKQTLAGTQNELSGTKQQLADTQQQLDGVRNTVSQQDKQLQSSTKEINNLSTCLLGVVTAIDYAAAGNYAAENAELNRIRTPCRDGLNGLP
jgi:hypothetical protein